MTRTLIATSTLDACIRIRAPPPPPTHTALHWHMHMTPQHKTYDVQAAEGDKRAHTNTAQTPLECQAIMPPPPFPFYGVGAGAACMA